MAFNDATCPKCGKKISWIGSLANRPPCPRCGHQIPLEDLQRDEEEIRAAMESILEAKKGKKQTFE